MDSEKPGPMLNIEGPSGASVFRRLLLWLVPFERLPELQAEFDAYWQRYRGLADDRAAVVVCALCVEDSVDEMIKALFPKGGLFVGKRDIGLALKIDMLRAFKIIPARILHDCHLIRRVRNDFAHHLRLASLSDWGDDKLRSVDGAIKAYDDAYDLSVSHRKRFEDLTSFVCVALRLYATHVQAMRAFVDSSEFGAALKSFKEKGSER